MLKKKEDFLEGRELQPANRMYKDTLKKSEETSDYKKNPNE